MKMYSEKTEQPEYFIRFYSLDEGAQWDNKIVLARIVDEKGEGVLGGVLLTYNEKTGEVERQPWVAHHLAEAVGIKISGGEGRWII